MGFRMCSGLGFDDVYINPTTINPKPYTMGVLKVKLPSSESDLSFNPPPKIRLCSNPSTFWHVMSRSIIKF